MTNNLGWFGIDFGTTNSAAFSFTGAEMDEVHPIHYGDDVGRPFPSVVAINSTTGEVIVGRDAKDRQNTLIVDCEYFTSIKSIIDSDRTWTIAGRSWTAEDIAAEIFKALKGRIECKGDNVVEEAVLAVPVGFSSVKKEHLRRAAQKAGIHIKMFVSEPTAAFCSNYSFLKECRYVAVFDWGGGTLDVAVLKIENGKVHELSTEGMQLAGNDIDQKLAAKMHARFMRGKAPAISFEELDPLTKDQLLLKCEKSKCDFCDEDIMQISLNKYGEYGPVREAIDYEFFALLIEPEISAALDCLERAIKKANLNSVNLDKILCVGGSSKLRPFRERLENIYGEDLLLYPDKVMWDIAKGAAMIATRPGQYYLDKSIGMLLSDGAYFPLLRAGQKIPCEELQLSFGVVEGEKEAHFIFTDDERMANKTFSENFVLPMRGFADEYIRLSCYIDSNFIFKLRVGSSRTPQNRYRVWSYDKLKICYQIEGDQE